jgi:3-hydroxyacyl-CoA dehydrogenase
MNARKVRVERDGDIAVFVIDNPPVNAASVEVRQALLAAIEDLSRSPALQGAIIIGGGSTFIAGSDLKEFGQPLLDPQLPDVIAAIEHCGKPIVAALHGAALGGGYELALGCDSRVAAPGTVVGLPEVTLGIVPGAGGTQRLPRLVGVVRAIQLVVGGTRVSAEAALATGMVDVIADGDLRSAAVAHARSLNGRKSLIRDAEVPFNGIEKIKAAAEAALKAGKQRPAARAAIAAVMSAATMPFDQALAQERVAFQELRVSREAKALRHLFFAQRAAGRDEQLLNVAPRVINSIAVVGAGTMGSGIALCALDAGLQVVLLEQNDQALEMGSERIRQYYADRVKRGKLTTERAAQCMERLRPTTDWDHLTRVDMVIEAVFEDMQVKQALFRRIDSLARPGAILASNTSYLDLDAIAACTSRPQDVIGLHFFSPAHVMRLLELVRGSDTAPDVLATGVALGKRLGKISVISRNAFGFIGNRIYAAYRKQCEFMLEEGAYPEQIDAALEHFGFAMGPFSVADMSGLDIAWRMRSSQAAKRDPAARYVHIPDRLCEAGLLGRKTDAGYYRYTEGRKASSADAAVRKIIEDASMESGVSRRRLDAAEIVKRALLAMVNEAALLLGEGVAARAEDVDVVLANGYGFPSWEGGPVFWARELGEDALAAALAWLATVSGAGFVKGDAAVLFPM